jgi:hypothetical protein
MNCTAYPLGAGQRVIAGYQGAFYHHLDRHASPVPVSKQEIAQMIIFGLDPHPRSHTVVALDPHGFVNLGVKSMLYRHVSKSLTESSA